MRKRLFTLSSCEGTASNTRREICGARPWAYFAISNRYCSTTRCWRRAIPGPRALPSRLEVGRPKSPSTPATNRPDDASAKQQRAPPSCRRQESRIRTHRLRHSTNSYKVPEQAGKPLVKSCIQPLSSIKRLSDVVDDRLWHVLRPAELLEHREGTCARSAHSLPGKSESPSFRYPASIRRSSPDDAAAILDEELHSGNKIGCLLYLIEKDKRLSRNYRHAANQRETRDEVFRILCFRKNPNGAFSSSRKFTSAR